MPDPRPKPPLRSPSDTSEASRPLDEQRGIVCRSCGCRFFRVLYTRAKFGGKIMRRRECRHCGRRLTTWEQLIGR